MHTEIPAKEPGVKAVPERPASRYGEAGQESASGVSLPFILFTVLLVGLAAVAGSVKSGKLNLNQFFSAPKAGAQASPAAHPTAAAAPHAAPAAKAPPLKPDAFVVTSISIGQPSFAIINGKSRIEGDPVEAPGTTGWKVKRIVDGAVFVENGSSVVSLPLSTPGIKPLDDELHPLN